VGRGRARPQTRRGVGVAGSSREGGWSDGRGEGARGPAGAERGGRGAGIVSAGGGCVGPPPWALRLPPRPAHGPAGGPGGARRRSAAARGAREGLGGGAHDGARNGPAAAGAAPGRRPPRRRVPAEGPGGAGGQRRHSGEGRSTRLWVDGLCRLHFHGPRVGAVGPDAVERGREGGEERVGLGWGGEHRPRPRARPRRPGPGNARPPARQARRGGQEDGAGAHPSRQGREEDGEGGRPGRGLGTPGTVGPAGGGRRPRRRRQGGGGRRRRASRVASGGRRPERVSVRSSRWPAAVVSSSFKLGRRQHAQGGDVGCRRRVRPRREEERRIQPCRQRIPESASGSVVGVGSRGRAG